MHLTGPVCADGRRRQSDSGLQLGACGLNLNAGALGRRYRTTSPLRHQQDACWRRPEFRRWRGRGSLSAAARVTPTLASPLTLRESRQRAGAVEYVRGRPERRSAGRGGIESCPCRRGSSLSTRGIERLALPVRHGEGKLVAPADLLGRIDAAHLGAGRYTTTAGQADSGSATVPYPANPNGSVNNLAGLCDPSGQVFGLMPHPEAFLHRHHHPTWRNAPPEQQAALDDGARQLFRNAVRHAAAR